MRSTSVDVARSGAMMTKSRTRPLKLNHHACHREEYRAAVNVRDSQASR
jgi:hypothetical protein